MVLPVKWQFSEADLGAAVSKSMLTLTVDSRMCCNWLHDGRLFLQPRGLEIYCFNESWSSVIWDNTQMCLAQLSLLLIQSPISLQTTFLLPAECTLGSYISNRGLRLATKLRKINPGHYMISLYSKDQSTPSAAGLPLLLLQSVLLIWSFLRLPQ